MCGASFAEIEATADPEQVDTGGTEDDEKRVERKLPGWVRVLIVVGLALVILSVGAFGYFRLMTIEPPVPEAAMPTLTPTLAPPTSTPTRTPPPFPTSTPIPPLVHQVQEGETLIDIANRHDVTVEEIVSMNPELDPQLLQVGQIILIPPATPTPGPTSTLDPDVPTPTPPEYIVHIVYAGENLGTIAEEYPGVTVALIRVANDLPADDDTIRVNQSLIIPLGTPAPRPTPTVDPDATATPIPPYPAPALLSPSNDAAIVVDGPPILLQWASVGLLADDEWYELTLLKPPDDTVVAQTYTRATGWRVPLDLRPIADMDRPEFRWQVRVVRETRNTQSQIPYQQAGVPSEVRIFTWLIPTPTPTPTPHPTSTAAP